MQKDSLDLRFFWKKIWKW